MRFDQDVLERFCPKVEIPSPGTPTERAREACWLWRGSTDRGYGVFVIDCHRHPSHRFAYRLVTEVWMPELVAEDGWTLLTGDLHAHHRCETKLCANPWHIQPLHPADHAALHRGEWPVSWAAEAS